MSRSSKKKKNPKSTKKHVLNLHLRHYCVVFLGNNIGEHDCYTVAVMLKVRINYIEPIV